MFWYHVCLSVYYECVINENHPWSWETRVEYRGVKMDKKAPTNGPSKTGNKSGKDRGNNPKK
ncbi:MAG: hypothetical protein KAG14_04825 [Mycoplasmataceae bacterium]|nr:hypothetical protein [Mycoplasmataceae bacterium]